MKLIVAYWVMVEELFLRYALKKPYQLADDGLNLWLLGN